MKRLDRILDEEVERENAVLEEAKNWDAWREKLQEKQLDAQACVRKAEVGHKHVVHVFTAVKAVQGSLSGCSIVCPHTQCM